MLRRPSRVFHCNTVGTIYRVGQDQTGDCQRVYLWLRSGSSAYTPPVQSCEHPIISPIGKACAIAGNCEEALFLLDDACRSLKTGMLVLSELYRHKGSDCCGMGIESGRGPYRQSLAIAGAGAKLWNCARISLAKLGRDQVAAPKLVRSLSGLRRVTRASIHQTLGKPKGCLRTR